MSQDFLDAVKAGDVERATALLDSESHVATTRAPGGESPVLLAIYYGHPELARTIADRVPRLDVFEASALGRLDRVEAEIEERPDLVNAFAPDGFTPLGLAAFFGHPEVARALLAHGAEPNTASRNQAQVMPLHSAAAARQTEIAAMLLAHGAEVNATQGGGFVPLHSAAQNGQVDMARLLLEYGADATLRAANGQTPLEMAEANGHEDVAGLLRQQAAPR